MIKNHINDKKTHNTTKIHYIQYIDKKKPKIISKNIKCGVLTV